MPKNPYRPYTPHPEFMNLLEDYSGNLVNGVGEEETRRPTMVWWAPDMEAAEFGRAQRWFYEHEQPDDEMRELRVLRSEAVAMALPPISEQRVERTGEEWTAELGAFIRAGDCEMTGVTRLRPNCVAAKM